MHQNDNTPPAKRIAGLACAICHRGGAKSARVRVEIAEKVTADERMDLCPDCASNRYRVQEAIRRMG